MNVIDCCVTVEENLPEPQSLRVENKTFYFDIGQNRRGTFMRISEVRRPVFIEGSFRSNRTDYNNNINIRATVVTFYSGYKRTYYEFKIAKSIKMGCFYVVSATLFRVVPDNITCDQTVLHTTCYSLLSLFWKLSQNDAFCKQ